MPELPEVHGYQQYINGTCLDQKIIHFECRDDRLLKKPQNLFKEYLVGQELTGTHRIGKYLFIKTTGQKILVLHFGMTGRPSYYQDKSHRPKFGHVVLGFENGFHFAFENKRKFGWWDLIDSIDDYKSNLKLSTDARDLSYEEFVSAIKNRKVHVKTVLLDQRVAAGLGNWMVDEILYQSRIHPQKKTEDLSPSDYNNIFQNMKKVIEVAIKHEAHYPDFPVDFLMHFRETGGTCHHTGAAIEKITVGGRSTYYSREWQQL